MGAVSGKQKVTVWIFCFSIKKTTEKKKKKKKKEEEEKRISFAQWRRAPLDERERERENERERGEEKRDV